MNDNFLFGSKMFDQVFGTVMGTKFEPSYACLSIGHQKETNLFTQELPKYFLVLLEYFSTCLNNLHPGIKNWFEKAKLIQSDRFQHCQVLNFLDIEAILHSENTVETDIYCKDTNAQWLPSI